MSNRMASANRQRWLPWVGALSILVMIAVPFVVDYSTLRRLQESGRRLRVGMNPDDVRKALGSPHARYSTGGWFGTLTPGQEATDAVWDYRTRFDWYGRTSLSSPDPRPRLWVRLFPNVWESEVLTVWFRDGKVIGVATPEGNVVE